VEESCADAVLILVNDITIAIRQTANKPKNFGNNLLLNNIPAIN
jgi:hypothetical protein